MRPGPDAPVLALDIDGTSGDYHAHFTWFISQWLGRSMPDPEEYTGGVPFHNHLGVSRDTYNKCKLAYRRGGIKRFMPVVEGIGEFTAHVRNRGVQVWICTTRPYLSLEQIDEDTRHWLRRAHIQYDGIMFGAHKYNDLIKQVGKDRVLMAIDDLPEQMEVAVKLGIPAFLRSQPYNMYYSNDKVTRLGNVDDFRTAFDLMRITK